MTRLPFRRFIALMSVAASAAALVAMSSIPSGPSAGASPGPAPWTVSVTPTTNVSDGALVSINLRTPEDHPIFVARAQVCRSGVDYSTSTTSQPNEDFFPGGSNCPSIPISSSADVGTVDSTTFNTATTPEGETFTMYVGTGVVEWISDLDSSNQKLTCDFENPCSLVVEVRGRNADGVTQWIPFVQELKFAADDPIAGCGGPADGMVSTGGSERISGAWVDLTLDQCHAEGAQAGAATSASFAGEKDAMEGFSSGSLDLAYSAVGYDPTVGFGTGTEAEPLTKRPSVAVPVNLNAVVVAVGNGRSGANEHKVPYSNVRMTVDQITHLFSAGAFEFTDAWLEDFYNLNPQFRTTGLYVNSSPIKVGASSAPDSQAYFFTDFLHTRSPGFWKVPDTPSFGSERGQARSVTPSLAVASPSFGGVLDFYSGQPLLKKAIRALSTDAFGGVWVMTDLATAAQLGLSVVSIENSNGAFVAPNGDSMAAAVSTMKIADDGRLLPDPSATVDKDAVQPYPLTYVEYAIAPTEKLVDSKCVARKKSQALLTTWLSYYVGDGQSKLPLGYGVLPDELKTAATDAIAKVGSEYPACLTPETPSQTGGSNGAGGGSGGYSSNSSYRSTSSAGGSTTAGDPAATTTGETQLVSAEIPAFDARSSASTVAAVFGLLVVFALLSGMALISTGRVSSPRRFFSSLRGGGA